MGGEAAESPLKPLADLEEMTQNRVNEALLDLLPGSLISEIVEQRVRDFIGQSLDAMVEKAVTERFEEAMSEWLRDAGFTDRIGEIGQQFIDNNIPKDRIERETEKRVATLMGGKVDKMIYAAVEKRFQECIDNWVTKNLTELEFGDKYEDIVAEAAHEYARGMGQNLLTNVMKALQMVGSGVIATANAAMHDDLAVCPTCKILVKSNEQCPMCKQYVY